MSRVIRLSLRHRKPLPIWLCQQLLHGYDDLPPMPTEVTYCRMRVRDFAPPGAYPTRPPYRQHVADHAIVSSVLFLVTFALYSTQSLTPCKFVWRVAGGGVRTLDRQRPRAHTADSVRRPARDGKRDRKVSVFVVFLLQECVLRSPIVFEFAATFNNALTVLCCAG